ncbi:hypothetical protein [Kitasatospora sp. DSM 101779]|uniref:hypothetical protein n=1 Tax=Kitasatospora sp. DSM 101779 TaxID=2853165 RepID=UPI0021D9F770|nr:hypothetical protein [Kitasatospora sp. DSM 101779]MCU7824967.1 hypothetical protein [Kitasatospora sp. DSM 101779]
MTETASGSGDAGTVLAGLALLGPVLAPALLLLCAVGMVRARRDRPPHGDAGLLVRLSLMGLCVAYGAFSTGLMSGPTWMSAREYCGARGFPAVGISTRMFPVSVRCGPDGELVPSWVNPVLVGGLVLALAALGAAAVAAYRSRRNR